MTTGFIPSHVLIVAWDFHWSARHEDAGLDSSCARCLSFGMWVIRKVIGLRNSNPTAIAGKCG